MTHLPIIGPAIKLVAQFIQFLGDATGGNLGVTIILFTIFIKLLLAPLTFKSIKSSKAMQDVAPIIKDLQKKYKDDKQTFAQKQMEVYQQYGINPLAGCLPVLIQLPVFLVVYQAMRQVSQNWTGHKGFLWVSDLTKIESVADHLRILVFCAFIFQVIQTRMSLPNAAKRAQQDQQTKLQSTLLSASSGAGTCLRLELPLRDGALLGGAGSLQRRAAVLHHRLGLTPRHLPLPPGEGGEGTRTEADYGTS